MEITAPHNSISSSCGHFVLINQLQFRQECYLLDHDMWYYILDKHLKV